MATGLGTGERCTHTQDPSTLQAWLPKPTCNQPTAVAFSALPGGAPLGFLVNLFRSLTLRLRQQLLPTPLTSLVQEQKVSANRFLTSSPAWGDMSLLGKTGPQTSSFYTRVSFTLQIEVQDQGISRTCFLCRSFSWFEDGYLLQQLLLCVLLGCFLIYFNFFLV